MMGLAYGTGGLLTPLTGKLADIFSIRPVPVVIAVIPVLTVVPIVYLFSKNRSASGS
jgi:FSR family fosmidomycin resistance protein-like MFS transporter